MTPWSGNPRRDAGRRFALDQRPRRRRLREDDGRAAVRPGLRRRPEEQPGRRLQPALAPDRPARRPAGAERRRHHPGAGDDRQAGRHPLLPRGGARRRRGERGEAEAASSSCPAASLVGTAAVAAGTGPAPLQIDGKVFLSGPYHGAPLSLAVVTPATAGPFDLGTVVVRVALFVDPETAQIRAVSDPIPDVFGGAQLSIRSVDLKIDRDELHPQPDQLRPARPRRRPERRRRRPDRPGRLQRLPGQRSLPDQRLRRARLPAEAVHPPARRPQDRQALRPPEIPRRPRRPRRATPTSAAPR